MRGITSEDPLFACRCIFEMPADTTVALPSPGALHCFPPGPCLAALHPALARSGSASLAYCRRHRSAALAEANADEAVAAGLGAQDHLVAVIQEAPLLARGEADRVLAACRDLEQ